MSISDQLEERFAPLVEEMGYELSYVEYVKEGSEWYLRFFIDKEEGIDLEDCEKVSRFVEEVLDEENWIENQYILEVSSLGLERPLRKKEDYEKHIGAYVMVHLYKKVEGKKEWIGYLKSYGDHVVLDVNGKEIDIPLDAVSKAHLMIEI